MPKPFPPPTLGRYTVRYLAVRFGAPDENQTVAGIPSRFDRARCEARLEYERAKVRIWHAFTLRWFGAEDGQPDSLAPAAREKARAYIADADAKLDAWQLKALRFPALLRAEDVEDLLDPWFEKESEK